MICIGIFVYLGVLSGLAIFLVDSDKRAGKTPDFGASVITAAFWPFLIIGIPLFIVLKNLDKKTP